MDDRNLREQLDLLTTITDRNSAHITYMDTAGRFRFVNRAFADWFRRPANEIIGRTLKDLVFDHKAYEISRPYIEKALSGQAVTYDLVVTRDGIPKALRISYTPDLDPKTGKIRGFMTISQDVTELKQALAEKEASESRFRSLTDTIPQLMWTALPNGQVDYVNARCLNYTGLNSIQKFGDGWVETIHPEDREMVVRAWQEAANKGEPFRQDYRIRGADGSYRWFSGHAIPIPGVDGKIQYWIGTATDIEDDKKISQELTTAKELAERANAAKSAFLANMSHEIRTPLGAVLGFSALLADGNLPSKERQQFVEIIERNGKWLTRIIDDILDLAKVESGRVEIVETEVEIATLLDEVCELFSEKIREKRISWNVAVEPGTPALIFADPVRLRQILINIIGNAVKFTVGGKVGVTVRSQAAGADRHRVKFEIKDTGCGVSAEQAARLFKPFSQADSTTTRKFGGTGLGLALSQRLAQAMGGEIRLTDYALHQGCTFVIEIEVREAKSAPRPRKVPARKIKNAKNSLQGFAILVVDDSRDIRHLVKNILIAKGAVVHLAASGPEALSAMDECKADLILMDIQMPGMDGYEVITNLRQKGLHTPVIAVTAHAMVEEKIKAQQGGFAEHLSKPFDAEELLRVIVQYCSR